MMICLECKTIKRTLHRPLQPLLMMWTCIIWKPPTSGSTNSQFSYGPTSSHNLPLPTYPLLECRLVPNLLKTSHFPRVVWSRIYSKPPTSHFPRSRESLGTEFTQNLPPTSYPVIETFLVAYKHKSLHYTLA